MTSSYSTDLKLELMVTGENAGTWGDKTNTNLNLIQQAIAGYEAVTITDSATTALVMSQAALSNARNMIIKIASITLTGATTVTIPNGIEKFYIFDLTAVTGVTNLTIKTASGTGFTAGEAKIVAAYSDGTNLNEIALDTLGGTIGTAQIADNAITSAKISANQVTTAKIADNAITTAKISALQVTGAKIAQSTITASKLATDSVGPDQLISTGVTAGAYTAANITVDADGRLTAASSGSSGVPTWTNVLNLQSGPGNPIFVPYGFMSGTYTANPSATKIAVFAVGGGGGAGGPRQQGQGQPGPQNPGDFFPGGAAGGAALVFHEITAPFSKVYQVGNYGNGGANNSGQDGQDTYLSNVVVAGGGQQGGWNQQAHAEGAITLSSPTDFYIDFNTGAGSLNFTPAGANPEIAEYEGGKIRDVFGFSGALAVGPAPQLQKNGFGGNCPGSSGGNAGGKGVLAIWENIGPSA